MAHPVAPDSRDPQDEQRVRELLKDLTLDEKIGLLHQHQAPVERLGLGAFRTGTEALHGLAWLGPATVYPQAVGLAATWDPDLVRRVGAATADETLAFHARDPKGAGRNVWAPVVNPLRDPRWGRNEEGYSEDPWLTGLIATAYARGLAGDGPRLRTAPTLKHFLGYNNETDRCTTSSDLPPRVLHEYELPAFLPALRDGAAVAVMPSYNLVNGRPAHLSPLINEVLREAAPDDLLVVSDAYAPANLVELQHFHPDLPTAYAHAIRAGLDSFTQDDERTEATLGHVREALRRGLLAEADIDLAVRHALSVRARLGEFDAEPSSVASGDEPGSDAEPSSVASGGEPGSDAEPSSVASGAVDTPEHRALAREAATRSITLLRNDGLLPLRDVRSVAVIGQLGDTLLEDWYSGTLPYKVTAREGIAARVRTVFCEGADRITLATYGHGAVVAPADGEPLRLVSTGAQGLHEDGAAVRARTPGAAFDLLDWGGGAHALRSVETGRYVNEGPDGTLVCDAPGPGTWEVRQTFRMEEDAAGHTVLVQVHSGRRVGVGDDLVLRLTGDPDEATPFLVDGLGSGALEAARVASTADVAVVVAGDHPMVNGRETEDRADLDLPEAQERVLRAVRGANPATVLVLSSGYPFAVTWADEHVPAVLWSAHGGQEYGHALADVLFGDAEPAGRLTQTWYRSTDDLPDLLDYDVITARGTYLYFEGGPLYPFGHGLGYTPVEYGEPSVRVDGGRVTVEVEVANRGTRTAEEVVQVYTRQLESRVRVPLRALRGFARLTVEPGASRTAVVGFDVDDLALWDTTRDRFAVEDAPREVLVGRSAGDIRATAPLEVPGEAIPPRDAFGRAWEAAGYDDAHGVRLCPVTRERGDAVRAAADTAWAGFHGVDLGEGAAEGRIVVNADREGVVRLRLDDPEKGPVAAVFAVPARDDRFAFTEVEAPVEGASGVRDIYLVFEGGDGGPAVESFAFDRG
ncbi:glycoside hydrolase family 3 protein [Nocardiopsis sp. NRRL B-16309]|uniref:glycoside hydrolase family 3 protein n=1 Tax=Nocardiopsis sp. NRRL B-16309 TaxID=1519494 RepID=UPI0006AF186A|nr:glycoside hydrolase family 3 protein [Nocardiopsis sp. NRRL B-16309]KOX17105.1 beta-glucosidase [Nocardiopsis sp. NRRL B-16309]